MDRKMLESGLILMIDWRKLKIISFNCRTEVIPVVVQEAATKEVLMVAYVNRQALEKTIRSGIAAFWSTSRDELWVKGKTSGCLLDVVEIRINCEQNSLLFLVNMRNSSGCCHTKDEFGNFRKSCYFRKLSANPANSSFWITILLDERKEKPC